jgi:hypothetical protein
MNALLRAIQRWLEEPGEVRPSEPSVAVLRQYIPSSSSSSRSGSRTVVKRSPRAYWEERGWRRNGRIFEGDYQTAHGSWHGCVSESPGGRVEVFIHNPPPVLERHPHWQCFNKRNDGWFFVHPVTRVADVSAGILGLEKTITEAYEL